MLVNVIFVTTLVIVVAAAGLYWRLDKPKTEETDGS